MSHTRVLRIRLLPEALNAVRALLDRLRAEPGELIDGLRAEGSREELFFLEQTPEGAFLLLITRASDIEMADRIFTSSTRPFDIAVRKFWEEHATEFVELELLADFRAN